MLTRYVAMSALKQAKLFTFGLALCFLGMVVTEMWVPMVVGAIILQGLVVEAWIRVLYLNPINDELASMRLQIETLESELEQATSQPSGMKPTK